MKFRLFILLLGLATLINGCNSDGCTENRNAVPLAQFYSSSTDEEITLDSLTIAGVNAPGDSILGHAGSRVSQIYLPMRPNNNSVKWCFSYKWKHLDDPRLNDTLTIDYNSQPYFASEECGAYFRYSITGIKVTDHLIDSVTVVDSLITNIDRVYLNIYFRTAER